MRPVIGFTDPMSSSPEKNRRYPEWIRRWIPDAKIVLLSVDRDNAHDFKRCHGIVLSGGVDISPELYGYSNQDGRVEETHPGRDAFEVALIRPALENNLPLLGICRGAQYLTNIVLGGSLLPDVEQAGYANHRATTATDRRHSVTIEPGSLLHTMAGVSAGEVNSAHHQAIHRLGSGLRTCARSVDGVVEACEWADPVSRGFLLLVQWHPERMEDQENPLAQSLLLHFAEALQRYITQKEHA